MKSQKNWAILTLALIGLISAAVLAFIAMVDPFQIYHASNIYLESHQRHQNPGLVRHYKNKQYNAVIIGDSMAENFRPSRFKNILDWDALNLSFSGATAYEMRLMADFALRENPDIRHVVWCLNFPAYRLGERQTKGPSIMPEDLYDTSRLNDIKSLFSPESLFLSFDKILRRNTTTDIDGLYNWTEESVSLFTLDNFFKSYDQDSKRIHPDEYKIENFIANITNNIIPVVAAHSDTTFHFFFPPYSGPYYRILFEKDMLSTLKEFKRKAATELLRYDNVALHDFQNADDIALDLRLYKDIGHYSEDVSNTLIGFFRDKAHVVTDANIEASMQTMDRYGALDLGFYRTKYGLN